MPHTLLEYVLAEFAPEFDEAAFIFIAVLLVRLALVPGFEFGLELVVEFMAHGNVVGWLIKRRVGNILPLWSTLLLVQFVVRPRHKDTKG